MRKSLRRRLVPATGAKRNDNYVTAAGDEDDDGDDDGAHDNDDEIKFDLFHVPTKVTMKTEISRYISYNPVLVFHSSIIAYRTIATSHHFHAMPFHFQLWLLHSEEKSYCFTVGCVPD